MLVKPLEEGNEKLLMKVLLREVYGHIQAVIRSQYRLKVHTDNEAKVGVRVSSIVFLNFISYFALGLAT